MRRPLAVSAVFFALGLAAVQAPMAQAQVNHRPQDTTPRQDVTPSAPNEDQKANQSLSNPPQSGRTEPSATNAADAQKASPGPVFVDGMLSVPGAPSDSQTRPAKFSQKNDTIDKQPIMAMRLARLSDEQRQAIIDAVGKANTPVAKIKAKPSEELPMGIDIHEMPQDAAWAADLKGLKFVRVADGVLLVDAANRIVVGEVKE